MQNPHTPECLAKPLHSAENISKARPLADVLGSNWFLAGTAAVFYWLWFFNQIRGEWQVNPQYNYGYAVPLLGAVLFWRRWPGRPAPSPCHALTPVVICGLLLLSFPLRVLFEANPEWRLLYCLSGFAALGLSLCVLDSLGGLSWARYFAPPLLFMFVALPWPVELEQAAIQGLMRFVAGLTVGVVTVLGIPAIQHGNLIEVGAGIVGIDEACSGVRSLQSSLMLSLFLGELNRWSWKRRTALLGASMLFVLLANLVRTTILVCIAATHGLQRMQAWHDTAGLVIMFIVLPGLLGLSYWMRPRKQASETASSPTTHFHSVPRWIGVTMLLWLVGTEIVTEIWYRVHENQLTNSVRWSVAWPQDASRFSKTQLPENSRVILRCDNSESATWQDDLGNDWSAFVLTWYPGRNSTQLAKGHRPEVCFPAAGAKLVKDFGRVTISADGVNLPFHYQSFETGDRLLNVFYCLWSDKVIPGDDFKLETPLRAGRIRAALAGERNLGQKVLEIVICGPETRDEAIDLLKSKATALIRRN